MKHHWWLVPVLLAVIVVIAIAGHGHYKCTKSTQECLDMMVANLARKGWIGAEFGKTETGKLTVKNVSADSPADRAGFREGDTVIAINGVVYDEGSKEAIKKQWKEAVPGKTMTFTLSRSGHEKDLTVTLEKIPREMIAAYVGNHILDHANMDPPRD